MQTKNQVSLTRKTLNVIMLLGLIFSAFGEGSLPSVQAQEGATDTHTPTPEVTETPTNITTGGYVLSDGQFVYGPNVGDFNSVVYLQDNAPHLLKYADDMYGRSEYFSVNPKVYLTLLEVHAHLVSNPDTAKTENPFDLNDGDFLSQIDYISKVMLDAYYLHLYKYSSLPFSERDLPTFITRNGNVVNVTPDTNAGTYSIIAALAEIESDGNISIILDNNQPLGFYQTYIRLFPNDNSLSEKNLIPIPGDVSALAAPSDLLQLPYSRGESWRFNGVHDAAGGSSGSAFANASSIDFSPSWPTWNTDTGNMWVVAATSGVPTKISNCNFKISRSDGWETVYYHLESIQSFSGWINQNDRIGVIANTLAEAICNGGSSTGPHVHFTLKYNGAYVALNGTPLSNWLIHSGRWNYDTDRNYMWLEKSGTKKFVGDLLLSEAPGGGTSCNPTADQIALYADPNYGGSCVVKGVGNYADSGSMGIANDSVSSVKVGGNVKLTLYGDSNYGSTSETFTNDDSNLSNNSIGDNQASSAKVETRSSGSCNPNADQVALYIDSNYGGSCVVKGIGDYPNPGSLGIANDSVSSIKVGGNVKLTLCRDDNYSSTCDSFTGDDSNLSDNGIGDNQVSSAKVESRPTGGSCTNGAASGAIQPGYNFCANEGGTCTFSGQASVAYGANNCFFYQTFTSSVSCSNGAFGDPINGTGKTCSYKILTPPPSANFDAWGLSGTAPFTSAMHIVNTSNIASCSWNYGDGQTGTSCASTHNHTYNTAGTFSVSLTVSGPGGSDSMTRTNYISVTASSDSYEPDNSSGTASWISSGSTQTHNIIPSTDVDYVKFEITRPSALTLETTGPTGNDTRMWLYDGSLSQVEYSDDEGVDNYSLIDRQCSVDALPAGVYYIKVDDFANDNEIPSYNLSFTITQDCTPPSANFDAWPQSGNAPFVSTMHIVDTSNITSCSWNYGDGQTGTSCASLHDHTYTNAGTYTVNLIVNGPGGSDSMTRTNYIVVSAIPNAPSNFTVTGTTNNSIALTWQDNSNNETGFNIYRWDSISGVWDFHLYAQVGANVHNYTNTQLSCSTDYYYQVSAYNTQHESDRAGWIKGATVACPQSELSIASITFDPVSPFTNDDVWMIVAIQNNSNTAASGFWIDYYVDNVPTGCSDWGSYWNRSNGLAANSTDEFWIRLPANRLTAGTHQFRAYIDSGCEIIEADENNNIATAAFTLTVPPVAPPAHDDFGSARLVSPIPYSNTVDVSGATTASDDPYVPDCEGVELAPGMTSVWYKYTPTANESLYLDTFGSSYDTYIAVWSGTRGNLSSIACNDDLIGHDRQSGLPVNLTAGTTYYFEIAQYSDSTPISSLSAASTTETDLRSSNTGTLVTKSAPNLKPTSDLEAQAAGGTLQFHVLPKSFAAVSLWTADFSYSPQGWRANLHPRMMGDVNGDGKDDVVGFGYGGILVGLSNGSGFNPATSWTTDFSYNQGWRMDTYPRMVGDVNGDGKADVVGFGYAGAVVALSNGVNGFAPLSLWTTDYSYNQGWRVDLHPRVLGDVNGDGKDDIIGFGYGGILVGLSNGHGFNPVISWTTDFSYNQGWRMDTYPRMVGDVNGDGKADVVGFGYAGAVVALSNGSGFDTLSLWTSDFSYYPQGWRANMHPRVLGDVNNDGKDDIIGFGYGGGVVALSNGSGFDPVTSWTTDFSYNQGWRMDTYPRMAGDVNGDGKDDAIGFGYSGVLVAVAK